MKRTYALTLLFFVFSNATYCDNQPCDMTQKQSPTPVWMTIFVHGAVEGEWIFTSLIKAFRDSVDGSTYQKAVSAARQDPLFYRFHAMQEQGLKKITLPRGSESGLGASAVAQMYDQITACAQQCPTINYYYTYGWSGLVSQTQRLQDAQEFYNELLNEIITLGKKHKVAPRIRLIAYSHGGNICLNLARAKKREFHDACVSVDELIVLGSPIQPETDRLASDPMFKKIYNFYSTSDLIQPLEFVSSRSSSRTFKPHTNYEVPSKVKQVSVKVVRYAPHHAYRKKDVLQTPLATDYDKIKIKKIQSDPGHIELWHMGWTPSMYRKNFPLYPLPIVDFVSYITAQIDNDPKLGGNLTVTIHPQQEVMYLKDRSNQYKTKVSFVCNGVRSKLNAIAQSYEPDEDYYAEYKERMESVLKFAKYSRNGGLVKIKKPDGSFYKITKESMCLN